MSIDAKPIMSMPTALLEKIGRNDVYCMGCGLHVRQWTQGSVTSRDAWCFECLADGCYMGMPVWDMHTGIQHGCDCAECGGRVMGYLDYLCKDCRNEL